MRWTEFGLLLVPVGLFIAWRRAIARGERGPSRRLLSLTLVGLLVVAATMAFTADRDGAPPSAIYIPAQVQDGVIVPAHVR